MKRLLLFVLPLAAATWGCAYPAQSFSGGYPGAYPAPQPPIYPRPYGPQVNLTYSPVGRWDNVMMTAVGTPLFVLMRNGATATGEEVSATIDILNLHVASGDVDLAASEVMRVDRLSGGTHDAVKDGARGAAFGAGVVGVLGLVVGHVPPAHLFAAGAIIGAEQNLEATSFARGATTIYLARSSLPLAAPPVGQYPGARGTARGPCAPGASACNSQVRYRR